MSNKLTHDRGNVLQIFKFSFAIVTGTATCLFPCRLFLRETVDWLL